MFKISQPLYKEDFGRVSLARERQSGFICLLKVLNKDEMMEFKHRLIAKLRSRVTCAIPTSFVFTERSKCHFGYSVCAASGHRRIQCSTLDSLHPEMANPRRADNSYDEESGRVFPEGF